MIRFRTQLTVDPGTGNTLTRRANSHQACGFTVHNLDTGTKLDLTLTTTGTYRLEQDGVTVHEGTLV